MTQPGDTIRMRCSGQDYALTLDLSRVMGDVVEEMEEHLGGEGLIAWMQRLQRTFAVGVRIRDLRSRDIIAMIFLAKAQAEPGTTWQDVARTIAPYTLEVYPDAPPASADRRTAVHVRPDLGAQVPAPGPSGYEGLPHYSYGATYAPPTGHPLGVPQEQPPG